MAASASPSSGYLKRSRAVDSRTLPSASSQQGTTSSTAERRVVTTKPRQGSPITFGIEIEAVLAFHESKLQQIFDRYYASVPQITKDLSLSHHCNFVSTNNHFQDYRGIYPSWVVKVPSDTDLDTTLNLVTEIAQSAQWVSGEKSKLRKYLAEPLIIAKEALDCQKYPTSITALVRRTGDGDAITLGDNHPQHTIILQAPSTDINHWTLTTDDTLIGLLDSQLQFSFGDDISAQGHITTTGKLVLPRERAWDSSGFELISPKLSLSQKKSVYEELQGRLDCLKDGPTWRMLPSKWAALQVHIGLDFERPVDAPTLLLQHLAYVLICHEDLISRLHPRSRCGLPVRGATPPHELEFDDGDDDFDPDAPQPPDPTFEEVQTDNEARVLQIEAAYTGFRETKSNRRHFLHTINASARPRLSAIRNAIFDPELTVLELIALLQKSSPNPAPDGSNYNRDRGYMYNFNNIASMFVGSNWKTPKPTIEFRQHACSTCPAEIAHWVDFCEALVRLAEKMANAPSSPGSTASLATGGCPDTTRPSSGSVSSSRDKFSSRSPSLSPTTREFAMREAQKYTLHAGAPAWPCNSISQFCGPRFLDLDQEAVRYWEARYEKFKDDRPAAEEIDNSEERKREEFGVCG